MQWLKTKAWWKKNNAYDFYSSRRQLPLLVSICLSVSTSIFQFNYEPNLFPKIPKHLITRLINLVSLVCPYVSLSKDFTIRHTDLVACTRRRILSKVIWSLKQLKPVSSFIQAIHFVLSVKCKWQRSFVNWNRNLVI